MNSGMTAPANGQPLVVAIPSKGRLQENAAAFFARAGLKLVQSGGVRDYRGAFAGVPDVEVMFVSASDIVTHLAAGSAHLGVTGEDLIREHIANANDVVEKLTPLGFGHADVVVAVPKAWIDVRNIADLDDVAADMRARRGHRLRIATKYINLTRGFFASHGLADYRIVESLGATEGTPAAGAAEAIVDITTTGATLSANGLKVLEDGVILRSEAHFVASLAAEWPAPVRRAARNILSRIAAEEEARTSREVRAHLSPAAHGEAMAQAEAVGGRALAGHGEQVAFMCPKGRVYDLVEALQALGADDVTITAHEAVFRHANPLIERLASRIGPLA